MSVAVVDLKAELRAESEKAAAKAPSPSPSSQEEERARLERQRQRQRQEAAASGSTAAQYVVPAPIYDPSKAAPPTKESVGDGFGAGGRGMTAVVGTSPDTLGLGSVAGQVRSGVWSGRLVRLGCCMRSLQYGA